MGSLDEVVVEVREQVAWEVHRELVPREVFLARLSEDSSLARMHGTGSKLLFEFGLCRLEYRRMVGASETRRNAFWTIARKNCRPYKLMVELRLQ